MVLALSAHTHSGTWQASPQSTGRPRKTAVAPRAKAFRTSVPLLTPPSRYTSHLPATADTTSDSTSSYTHNICHRTRSEILLKRVCVCVLGSLTVAGTPSSCLAPWLDTRIPSTPWISASNASSAGGKKGGYRSIDV